MPPPPTHAATTTTFTVAGVPIEVDIDELCAGMTCQEEEHESENQRLHNVEQAKAKAGTSNAAGGHKPSLLASVATVSGHGHAAARAQGQGSDHCHCTGTTVYASLLMHVPRAPLPLCRHRCRCALFTVFNFIFVNAMVKVIQQQLKAAAPIWRLLLES